MHNVVAYKINKFNEETWARLHKIPTIKYLTLTRMVSEKQYEPN